MTTVPAAKSVRIREVAQTTTQAPPKRAGHAPAQNSGSSRVWGKKARIGLDEAVRNAITKAGFGFLSSLGDVKETALPKAVAAALEAFAEVNTGSGQGCSVGVLKLGKERVYVLSGANDEAAVVFTALDAKGKTLSQAQITADDQYRLTMKWVDADGKPGAVVCTMQYDKKGDISDAAWIKKAEAAFTASREKGDELGREVEASALPPAVRAQYDFLSRRCSDTCGARAFVVDGKKAYILCDYSSVSTFSAVAPNGRLLFDYAG